MYYNIYFLLSYLILLLLPIAIIATLTTASKTPQELFVSTNFQNDMLSSISESLVLKKESHSDNPIFLNYIESEWPKSCTDGLKQSPINFPSTMSSYITTEKLKIISANYILVRGLAMLYEETKIHVIEFRKDQGHLIVNKNGYPYRYNATRIEFHLPSEHTFDGIAGDMEMHIIHVKDPFYTQQMLKDFKLLSDPDDSFQFLYISASFKSVAGKENPNIRKLKVNNSGPVINFDLTPYAPIDAPFYFYEGSKTIPYPILECTENVNWVVLMKMETMSKEQLGFFVGWIMKLYHSNGNARQVKSIGSRSIYYQLYINPYPINTGSTYAIVGFRFLMILVIMMIL